MSLTRFSLALSAFFVLALGTVVAGCGGVPGDSVAKISDAPGDGVVKQAEFDRWMTIAGNRSGAQPGSAKVSVPDFPDYAKCVADRRKTAPKPAKGKPRTTDKQLKKTCKQEWEGLRDQVLGFLIAAQWLKGEAEEQGVKVSAKDVDKAFATQKKQAFPKEKDFKKFLKESGSTEADIRFQLEVEQLQQKLVEKIQKGADKVSDAEIKKYYDKNKAQFATPAARDLSVVLTKTKAKAQAAKDEVASGKAWKAVAKKYSTDPATKSSGGKQVGVVEGQLDPALSKAAFKASKGKVIGPIKTQFGYYVFRVDKTVAKKQQPLNKATKGAIKGIVGQQQQQKKLEKFIKEYKKKWKERTDCRAGYVVPDCKDGKTQTQPAGTPPAQGAPPAQGPPPGQ